MTDCILLVKVYMLITNVTHHDLQPQTRFSNTNHCLLVKIDKFHFKNYRLYNFNILIKKCEQ